jgi:hypothetical protein
VPRILVTARIEGEFPVDLGDISFDESKVIGIVEVGGISIEDKVEILRRAIP